MPSSQSQSSQSGQSAGQTSQTGQTPALSQLPIGQNISTNPNIQIYNLVVGTGTAAASGNTVSVTYVGALQDGTIFDASSEHGGQPFSFTLGAGQVIPGWDIGVAGMKVGGLRRLIISPSLGYGAEAVGPIPANSTLTFDVTLLGVK
jgi:FKBP-type peptidyl-prolyl cis-trans isomerase